MENCAIASNKNYTNNHSKLALYFWELKHTFILSFFWQSSNNHKWNSL